MLDIACFSVSESEVRLYHITLIRNSLLKWNLCLERITQHLFSCIERVRISLSLWRQVQSGFQSILAYVTIEVCHELYETAQIMACFIGLNLCIDYICMCLESFNIKEVKTSLGKPPWRLFWWKERVSSSLWCLFAKINIRLISVAIIVEKLIQGTNKPNNTYDKGFYTSQTLQPSSKH